MTFRYTDAEVKAMVDQGLIPADTTVSLALNNADVEAVVNLAHEILTAGTQTDEIVTRALELARLIDSAVMYR